MARYLVTTAIAFLGILGGRHGADPASQAATQPAATRPAATQPVAGGSRPTTQPASAVVDAALVGRYYTGDGLGYNLSLTLNDDGTFSCTWTGCLGVYGTASGTWSRSADRVNFVKQEATDLLRGRLLSGATVVGGGEFPALVLDQHLKFYEKHGRSRFSALQRVGDSGWIDDPPPTLDQPDPSTQPRKSWLRRLFTGS